MGAERLPKRSICEMRINLMFVTGIRGTCPVNRSHRQQLPHRRQSSLIYVHWPGAGNWDGLLLYFCYFKCRFYILPSQLEKEFIRHEIGNVSDNFNVKRMWVCARWTSHKRQICDSLECIVVRNSQDRANEHATTDANSIPIIITSSNTLQWQESDGFDCVPEGFL